MRGLRHAVLALILAGPAWAVAGPADALRAAGSEPASLALVSAGLVELGVLWRRRMPLRRLDRSWIGQPGAM